MFSILIWYVYGMFVGSIAKSVVPGEERMGFFQTVFLGVAGSYIGGAFLYMIGDYEKIEPAGIFMGVVGGVVGLLLWNKINSKTPQ